MWLGRLGFDTGFFELMLVYCWTWHQFLLRAGWDSWTDPNSCITFLILGFRQELIRRFFGWPRLSWLVNWRSFFPGAFTLTTESQSQFGLTKCTQEIEAIPGCFIVVWSLMLCTKTGVFSLGWGAHLGKTNKLWDVTPEPEMELLHFLKLESRVSENPILCACIHQ